MNYLYSKKWPNNNTIAFGVYRLISDINFRDNAAFKLSFEINPISINNTGFILNFYNRHGTVDYIKIRVLIWDSAFKYKHCFRLYSKIYTKITFTGNIIDN